MMTPHHKNDEALAFPRVDGLFNVETLAPPADRSTNINLVLDKCHYSTYGRTAHYPSNKIGSDILPLQFAIWYGGNLLPL